jgi:hypothetical protein
MVGIFPPKLYACFCVTDEASQAYDEAKAVFIGQVTEILKPRTDDPKALPAERLFVVKFKVEKSWKGAGFLDTTIPEISVLSDQGRAGCFSWGPFLEGRKYLVYAAQTNEEDLAVLFSCNRTSALDDASDDLRELRRMQSPFFRFERQRKLPDPDFLEGAHNKPLQLTAR